MHKVFKFQIVWISQSKQTERSRKRSAQKTVPHSLENCCSVKCAKWRQLAKDSQSELNTMKTLIKWSRTICEGCCQCQLNDYVNAALVTRDNRPAILLCIYRSGKCEIQSNYYLRKGHITKDYERYESRHDDQRHLFYPAGFDVFIWICRWVGIPWYDLEPLISRCRAGSGCSSRHMNSLCKFSYKIKN